MKAVQIGFLFQEISITMVYLWLATSTDDLPFNFAALHGRLKSDDAGLLFLEQSEAVLIVIVDDGSAWK